MSELNLDFAAEYGIYAKVLQCRDGIYVIGSLDPITDDVNPVSIIRRNERNRQLFYPRTYAVKLTDGDNIMLFADNFLKYCKEAEFIKNIYDEYKLPVPEQLRYNEVYALMRFKHTSVNENCDDLLRNLHKSRLDKFFKHEHQNGLRGLWRNFFRSEYYDEDAGKFKNLRIFLSPKTSKSDVDMLFTSSDSVKRLEMQEHEYKKFKKILREYYPDIQFAVSKKYTVDHGMIDIPGMGKSVTFEEFAKIRDKQFAANGYRALQNFNISHWEFRDVFFKIADEPIIAEVYHNLTLKFVNCVQLRTLRDRGDISHVNVPAADIMDFSHLANENNVKIYIDKWGEFDTPNFDTICVVYNDFDEVKVNGINNIILEDKIQLSHAIPKEPLSARIANAEDKRQDCNFERLGLYEKAM